MTWLNGPFLPLAALVWPLLLGVLASVPAVRPHALRLLPLAPLPALWLALGGAEGMTIAPDLLLGAALGVERPAALLLALTGALWFAAAIHAQGSMAGTRKPAVFTGFWCLTLAGNLGVFLAQDVVTFYVAFAAVSLSAYFLVVHDRTQAALRAGRVYAVLAILGEVCLLIGFVIGAGAADGLMIADIRAALPTAPMGGLATALLIAGFGIKAGIMPLHIWLPLAHPAAPTPASAVLSGAIVKAGIVGLMLFLPVATGAGPVLVILGFFTAFAGALAGLRVRAPKAILAYSTISQMGLVIALVGAATQLDGDMTLAAFYAFHHGLAKGALFLFVAVVAASTGRWRVAALVLAGLVALSTAGAPLSGGGLVKAAAKGGLEPLADVALTASAVTSTLVLGWFLHRLAAMRAKGAPPGRVKSVRTLVLIAAPSLALAIAALGLPWWLWSDWSGLPADYPFGFGSIWSALWPVGLGLGLVGVMAATQWPAGTLEEADPLRGADRLVRPLAGLRSFPAQLAQRRAGAAERIEALARAIVTRISHDAETLERSLLRWRVSGLAVLALLFILVAATVQIPGLNPESPHHPAAATTPSTFSDT